MHTVNIFNNVKSSNKTTWWYYYHVLQMKIDKLFGVLNVQNSFLQLNHPNISVLIPLLIEKVNKMKSILL